MKQFRDILVYAECDDAPCLAQVVAVAAAHGAAVTVCEIVEPPPRTPDSRGVVERLTQLRLARAHQRLRRICDHFAGHMVIDYAVYVGVPFVSITNEVVEQDFDLVVHISEAVQSITGSGLNATGMHLMRKCPCTVWALHPGRSQESRNVVLALDRELAEEYTLAEAFAITMAETALALADARGGELHVVHAWQPYGFELLDDPDIALSPSDRQFYERQQRSSSEAWFKRIYQRIGSLAPERLPIFAHHIQGKPGAVVQAAVDESAAGLLVLGTVGTSANPGVLIGPTTESILASSGVGVLTLKPPGFVSPLTMGTSRG